MKVVQVRRVDRVYNGGGSITLDGIGVNRFRVT